MTAEMIDPARTPRIASSRMTGCVAKARFASSSDTVNPMPPSAPIAEQVAERQRRAAPCLARRSADRASRRR